MGFFRQEYLRGLPCPLPEDLFNPRIESTSTAAPALQADSLPLSHQRRSSQEWDVYPPTPVFFTGDFHRQRRVVNCRPWACKVRQDQATDTYTYFTLLLATLCNNEMSTSCQKLGWSCEYQVAPQLWI